MTVVVGTAGHIDHGKTSLLRALTGIDADRLPEEQRRGMTIDVGYAHLRLPDGSEIDFVDVPGHDRLIGNMLVGAGEIDAAMLVIAADDGPRAQTLEHLELLDALGIDAGLAVVTKIDLVGADRRTDVITLVRELLDGTSLRGAPVLAASSATLEGLEDVRVALGAVQAAVRSRSAAGRGPVRLGIDRVFSVRGRGVVVTGSLRGGAVARGDVLRVEPAGRDVRVREVQVHNHAVERADGGGRVALNVAGADVDDLRRGLVLTAGAGIERSDRVLATLRPSSAGAAGLRHGVRVRLHLGTDVVDGVLDRSRRAVASAPDGSTTAIIRLDRPIAGAFGDAFVLRRPSPGETIAGGRILDALPPRGVARRGLDAGRIAGLAAAAWGSAEQLDALVALHGAVPVARVAAWSAVLGASVPNDAVAGLRLGGDVRDALETAATAAVTGHGAMAAAELRALLVAEARRRVPLDAHVAASLVDALIDGLVPRGVLVRDRDRVLPAGAATGPGPELMAAMERLEAALAVPAPPSLRETALAARCPAEGIRALETAGRIIRVEDDLAWEAATLQRFWALALRLAAAGPLSPAAFRDATGTSRRYALAILEDLDRRAVLRRTPAGHVLGPRTAPPWGSGAGGGP